MTTHAKVSDWLADLDSHALYPATLLETIPGVSVAYGADSGPAARSYAVLTRHDIDKSVRVTLESIANVERNPGKSGVTFAADANRDELVFSGFYVASRLALLFLGDSPGAAKMGRGFAYRADLTGLVEGGF